MPHRGEAVVGREGELARMGELLAAPATWPVALLVEGEAGAGKTALWTAATEAASAYRVLRARPSGAEAQLAFSVLGDLLYGVAEEALPALPTPQRRALEAALLLGDEPEPRADSRAVGVAVLGVLRGLAAAGPLVVAVDDEQWLDGPSASVLAFALRRLDREPVLALLARRAPGSPEPVAGVAAELDAGRLWRLTAGPLGLDAVRRLLEARLGVSWSRPALVRIHSVSGGNPMYAIELGRALLREGSGAAATGRLPAPPTLRGLVDDRLARLPAATLEVLAIAAAVDQPSLAVVEAVAERHVAADLDPAVADGVAACEGGLIRFAHPLLAVAAEATLSEERRRDVHRRLADVLAEPEARAMHMALGASGPDEAVARELAAAARRVHGRGAPLAAAELAGHAHRLTPPACEAASRERALECADYAFEAGGIDAARAILDAETVSAPAGADRARALVRLALLDTYDGDLETARVRARAALSEDVADASLRIVLHRRVSVVLLLLVDLAGAEEHAEAALRLAQALGRPATIAQATASLAFVRALRGRPVPASVVDRLGSDHSVAGHATIDDSPLAVRGLLRMYDGDLAGARECFDACIAAAAERGDESSLAGLLFCRAELACRAGRFHEASEHAERGLEASSQTRQRLTRAVSLFAKALADAHLGRVEAARAAAGEGRAIAARAGHRFAEAQNEWVLGFLELSLGRYGEAAAAFGRVLAFAEARGVQHMNVVPVGPDAVEALLGAGEVDAAAALVRRLGTSGAAAGHPLAVRRGAALVAAARGDPAAAVRALSDSLAVAGDDAPDFQVGRTLLALGQAQRRSKRKAPARQALTAARDRFAGCGARLWEETARAELARVGGRPPASDRLTPTERRVAALVCEGRSNKQVAAALFVTVKTVEAHLSRIYAKTGVRSRAELVHRLLADTPGGEEQSVGFPGVSAAPPQP